MTGLSLSEYDFHLPEELIAQDPLEKRSDSKLLVLDRKSGTISHDHFFNIGNYLRPGDCLVINNTRVIPARLYGVRSTGAAIEILLLKRLSDDTWECLSRPGKRTNPGAEIIFGDGKLRGVIEDVLDDGLRVIRFIFDGIFEEILDSLGEMPLPPYISHKLKDRDRYQTVYAKYDGSAAAPTAGLHFTPELLKSLQEQGVRIAPILLHVGLGTFRPVKEDNILDHKMHSEYYEVSAESAAIINETKAAGGRVIAVGTTSVRTIETVGKLVVASEGGDASEGAVETAGTGELEMPAGPVMPCSGDTEIFIYPGFNFKVTDAIVTNFHLPKSTLLMLISAFAGREQILAAYEEAVEQKYRFYSFGDSCLIL